MNDVREIRKTLDLALRVGEMLLSNGAGAADVTATASSIAHHYGLRHAVIDVTFTTLTITYQQSFDDTAYSLTRHVTQRETDFDDLTRVDHLVGDVLDDRVDLDEARSQMMRISSTGHSTPRWAITVSSGVTGAGIALLLGGDWLVMVIAAVAAMGIEVLQRRLARLRLPFFYAQVAGGLFASSLAVGVAATDVPVNPSLVISTSIVTLLAGLGFIGAIQDALTGFPLTAGARILEVMLSTTGIIVGVSGGLTVGELLGVDIAVNPGAAALSEIPLMVAGAAVAASAFAFSAYSPRRALLPIAVVGAPPRRSSWCCWRAAWVAPSPRPSRRSSSAWSATRWPGVCGCRRW